MNSAAGKRSSTSTASCEHGTGADRQLRVFHETGDLKRVVDYMVEETEAGLLNSQPRMQRGQ